MNPSSHLSHLRKIIGPDNPTSYALVCVRAGHMCVHVLIITCPACCITHRSQAFYIGVNKVTTWWQTYLIELPESTSSAQVLPLPRKSSHRLETASGTRHDTPRHARTPATQTTDRVPKRCACHANAGLETASGTRHDTHGRRRHRQQTGCPRVVWRSCLPFVSSSPTPHITINFSTTTPQHMLPTHQMSCPIAFPHSTFTYFTFNFQLAIFLIIRLLLLLMFIPVIPIHVPNFLRIFSSPAFPIPQANIACSIFSPV